MKDSVEVASQLIDTLVEEGGIVLYQTYLRAKIPRHLTRNEMLQLQQICDIELQSQGQYRPISSDAQTRNIRRDNIATKMIKKKDCTSYLVNRPNTAIEKKASNNSTRATTAMKSMSSTFYKGRLTIKPEQCLIKLPVQFQQNQQQVRLDQSLRKLKNQEIRESVEQRRKQQDEQNRKQQGSQKLVAEYRQYQDKRANITFGFNGRILPVTDKSNTRKVVEMTIRSTIEPKDQKKSVKATSKTTDRLSSGTQKNEMFTSLVYQLHSTKGQSKNESRLYKNDEYNNNNLRQTSHIGFVDLQTGVNLIQHLNISGMNRRQEETKEIAPNKTATFKHYLLDMILPRQETNNEQEYFEKESVRLTSKRNSMQQTGVHFRTATANADHQHPGANKSRSVCRPLTTKSLHQSVGIASCIRRTRNNGNQKITVSGDIQILIL